MLVLLNSTLTVRLCFVISETRIETSVLGVYGILITRLGTVVRSDVHFERRLWPTRFYEE